MSDKVQGRIGTSWLRCFFLVPFALCLAMPAAAQSLKIGYVNLVRIEQESPIIARGVETLRQEFEPRGLQIQEFQKRIEAARAQFESEQGKLQPAEIQARGREIGDMMHQSDQVVLRFQEELEQRRGELRAGFILEVRAALKVVGDAGRCDLILQEAIFACPAIDITGQVMKALAQMASAVWDKESSESGGCVSTQRARRSQAHLGARDAPAAPGEGAGRADAAAHREIRKGVNSEQ